MYAKYYLTVDELPLKAWRKANENAFHYLRRNHDIGTKEEDIEAWQLLYKDFIAVIGLTPEFKEYIELIQEKIEAHFEYLESKTNEDVRNRFLLNRIKVLDAQITLFNNTGGKGLTIGEILPKLSKMIGAHLSENVITTLEYFNYLKEYNGGK
jgi:hypothetical protein